MSGTLATTEPVATMLDTWHGMVARQDLSDLESLCRPDATFRSPAVHKPYETARRLAHVVRTAMSIFEDFTYVRESVSPDGRTLLLEFAADVDDRQLKGIDIITLDDDGFITEFEVLVRPLSGLTKLVEKMGERLDGNVMDM